MRPVDDPNFVMQVWCEFKHLVHCRDCGKSWVDEDDECACTCTGPGLETWVVTEICASCGQPGHGHPAYLGQEHQR
jgi:hypothetical protein